MKQEQKTIGSNGGVCDQTISQASGWFYSPNYPANYNDNSVCILTIEKSSADVCQVEITFEDFDLEDSRPACDNDFLDFGDGDRICGSLIPDFTRE